MKPRILFSIRTLKENFIAYSSSKIFYLMLFVAFILSLLIITRPAAPEIFSEKGTDKISETSFQNFNFTEGKDLQTPSYKLAYIQQGAKVYDFLKNKEIDFKVDYTSFIWSEHGKLALLEQGNYGGNKGFLKIPEAKATTDGFNYILYYADFENENAVLLAPEVFGNVYWSEDESGLYISEEYYKGSPLLLGNQSGIPPDEIKTFFVDLKGNRRTVDKNEFENISKFYKNNISPDRRYYFETDFTKNRENLSLILTENGKKYPVINDPGCERIYRILPSPDSKYTAYECDMALIRSVGDKVVKSLKVISIDLLLTNKDYVIYVYPLEYYSNEYRWIDNETLLMTRSDDYSENGNKVYLGYFFLKSGEYNQLLEFTTWLNFSIGLEISPDRLFFTYKRQDDSYKNQEIFVRNIKGDLVKILRGVDPSWQR